MINKRTKQYIFYKAEKENIVVPRNYNEILQFYYDIVAKHGHTLKFPYNSCLTRENLNANSGLFKHSSIIATPEWAFQLVCNNESAHIAFLMTLGHELTHKEKDLFPPIYGCGTKFVAWVNEVHADFGGVQKMLTGNRKIALETIEYKIQQKQYQKKQSQDAWHPSWTHRKYYIKNYNFNADLIRQIAEDVKYHNKYIVNHVSSHFEEIVLK